ncbi:MAG TPA: glycosyltransferase family 2 protein [Candidatus Elarobacter sp.]|nr:glycosyltransferase family 2 protein [Candidatus Elarobacter sp.]
MKLHGLARVKNEGDVIEEFVRHNLRFLDALTVIDNASFDGTLSVLESLRAEGLPLTILHDPILPKRQSETMTRAARQCAAEADWDFLFLLDADEFLKVADRDGLEQSLAAVAPHENGLLPWVSYVPTRCDDESEPRILNRITYRRAVESTPAFYKSVISRGFAQGGPFSIAQGNHSTNGADGEATAVVLHHAALAHFPVRSLVQIQSKALLGWGAYIAMGPDVGYGWHQRRLFERLESDPAWTSDDLYEIALSYTAAEGSHQDSRVTHDPLPPVPVWRFGNTAVAAPLALAAMYVRQLAGAIAEYEATVRKPQQAAIDR